MFPKGYAKHPCAHGIYSRGVAVHPIRPYRCSHPHTQGEPLCEFLTETADLWISEYLGLLRSTLPLLVLTALRK